MFVGSNSPSFYRMVVVAISIGFIINTLAHYISTTVLLRMSDKKRNISKFVIGLIVLFSFAPSIKVDLIYSFVNSLEARIFWFYLLQLLPLYIVLYLLTYSFIGIDTFSISAHYGAKDWRVAYHIFRKATAGYFIFLAFMFVYVLFDDAKSRIDSSLFKFADIQTKNPSLTQTNPKGDLISHTSPILLFIIFIILIYFLFRKHLARRLTINRINSTNVISFTLDESHLVGYSKWDADSLIKKFVIYSPYVILGIIILFYSSKYLFEFDPFTKLGFIWSRSFTYSVVLCSLVALLCFIALYNRVLNYILFFAFLSLGLLPQSIIGYSMSQLFPQAGDSVLNFRLFFGYFLSFGIFPFYFYSTYFKENAAGFAYSDVVAGFSKKVAHIYLIAKEPFKLSLGLVLLLTINDSMIIYSISYPSAHNKSFAYTLYNLQTNASNTNSPEFINNVTWLISINLIVVTLLPRLFELRKLAKKFVAGSLH